MRAVDSVPVPERLRLFDKMKPIGVFSRSRHVSSLISWKHHHTNFIYPRAQDFFNDDRQGCLRGSIPVDKSLQGKRPLIFAGGGDNCAFDFHDGCVLVRESLTNPSLPVKEPAAELLLIPANSGNR